MISFFFYLFVFKIFSSGWIIEPVLQNGQLYSMVSYLSQVILSYMGK